MEKGTIRGKSLISFNTIQCPSLGLDGLMCSIHCRLLYIVLVKVAYYAGSAAPSLVKLCQNYARFFFSNYATVFFKLCSLKSMVKKSKTRSN